MNPASVYAPPSPHLAFAGLTPGGRLTLASGTPVIASDQASKTVVYYTPYLHAYFPGLKNGVIKPVYFDEIAINLTAAHGASNIYDVFGVEFNGRGWAVTGPVWGTVTAGSGARGTTAGGPELTRINGVLVNKHGIPGLNGAQSLYISPREGVYLGSLFIDGSAGQVTCHTSFGQSRKWGVWNAFNRRPIILVAGDATASWAYGTDTLRASNNASANSLSVFCGLAEEAADLDFVQKVQHQANAAAQTAKIGIGVNSTTALSGFRGWSDQDAEAPATDASGATLTARHHLVPALGVNTITSLEAGSGTNQSFFGGDDDMRLSARWMG